MEDQKIIEEILALIEKYPNDMDLGKNVRRIISNNRKEKDLESGGED